MKTIHHPQYATLIARLRSRRLKLGLRQADVAARLGCSNTRVAKWEHRELRLDILDYARLCSLYRIDGRTLLRLLKDPP